MTKQSIKKKTTRRRNNQTCSYYIPENYILYDESLILLHESRSIRVNQYKYDVFFMMYIFIL